MKLPKIKVTFNDGAERSEEVTLNFADFVRFDIVRMKKNLPSREEGDSAWMATVAWAALIRTGKIPAERRLDDFLNSIIMAEESEENDGEDEAEFPVLHGNTPAGFTGDPVGDPSIPTTE